jgi:hypothetical protein
LDTPREGSMSLWLDFQLDDVKLSYWNISDELQEVCYTASLISIAIIWGYFIYM